MPPLPPTPVAGNKLPTAPMNDLDSSEIQLAEDNRTQGPVMQTELRDAAGTIQSISNLIRRVADSQRKLESARSKLQPQEQQAAALERELADEEKIQATGSKVVAMRSQLAEMRSQVAALERELALNQLELETVHASLHRKTEYLESRLLEKQRDLKAYQDLHRQGLTPIKEVNRIASEMAAAQAEWQEAEGVFGFLKESLDLIETGLDDSGEARNAEREATEQEAEKDDNEEQLEADSSADMEGAAVEDVPENEETAE
jgi:chromosome segregation ATPase